MNEHIFNIGLEYYIYLKHGNKTDFENEIKEYGDDYCAFYYDSSFGDTNYQTQKK